jgi:hypothetical protein
MSSAIRTLDRADHSVIDLRTGEPLPTRGRLRPTSILTWLLAEVHKPAAFLFPLRVFIGIGWLRSVIEKLGEPAWLGGQAVGDFLTTQTTSNAVAIPVYDWLIGAVLRPAGPVVGWNPSAFYIVIQIVLFVTGAGAVLGFDQLLAKRRLVPSILVVAKPEPGTSGRTDRLVVLLLALDAALLSLIGFSNVSDFSPTGITDSALVLGTVMAVATFSLLILRLRMIDPRRLTSRLR